MAIGGQLGVWYPSAYLVPLLLLDPAALGGSGSVDYVLLGASIGILIGTIYGGGVGIVVAAVLAFSWFVRLPGVAVILLGASALVMAAFGMTIMAFGVRSVGGDWSGLLPEALGSTHGIAGLILIVWVAGLRPHDHADAMDARKRESEHPVSG
jgi:hypothetical protein